MPLRIPASSSFLASFRRSGRGQVHKTSTLVVCYLGFCCFSHSARTLTLCSLPLRPFYILLVRVCLTPKISFSSTVANRRVSPLLQPFSSVPTVTWEWGSGPQDGRSPVSYRPRPGGRILRIYLAEISPIHVFWIWPLPEPCGPYPLSKVAIHGLRVGR